MPIIVMGDFNIVLDRKVGRFPHGTQTGATVGNRLSLFLREAKLMDIWRARNPTVQRHSCFSRTHATLSRIDMVLGNEEALQLIKKCNLHAKRSFGPLPGDSINRGEGEFLTW